MPSPNIGIAERCQFGPGDYIDGVWRIDSFLGEGTFGQVFRVKDSKDNTYALKLLKLWEVESSERSNLLKRFDREYETGRIRSDFLVHSLHKGIVKGNAYIVMEYCKGGDLLKAMNNACLDLPLLANHILSGLKDLHLNGKVHRDLKPENVLLRDMNHAALTDFGISGDQNNRLTQRGWLGVPQQRFGTIAYMPPEQINPKRGNATVLPTTDIFSFGVMIYQLLTGNLPFGKLESQSDVPPYVYKSSNGIWNRSLLAEMPEGGDWLKLIEGCLVPDFNNRFQTTDDVARYVPRSASNNNCVLAAKSVAFKSDIRKGMQLRVMQGEEPGRAYILNQLFTDNCTVLYVGRNCGDVWNHIGIKEDESRYISRRHCTIEKDRNTGRWIIRDGQYRVTCHVGLRIDHIMPCSGCAALCGRRSPMEWTASLNGTYVNSNEVHKEGVVLSAGDIVSIGDVKMRVEGL